MCSALLTRNRMFRAGEVTRMRFLQLARECLTAAALQRGGERNGHN
jgi:hypothetical protein